MSRIALFALVFVGLTAVSFAGLTVEGDLLWRRGDANNDTSINISDVNFLSNYLYDGGPEPPCMNQADVNDDGDVDGSDPIYLGNWLFNGGPPPPDPGPYNPYCDPDPTTPHLGCNDYYCP